MPRQARTKSNSGIYHIMLRGINQQQIFEDEQDYKRFLKILEECKAICEYKIYAYCLMGNHIHLLLETGKEDCSLVMKRICTRFVYWYNLKYNRVGHLFQDRYRSEPVEDESYLVMATVYIHQNPMKSGITKGLSYKYSSYDNYIKNDFWIVDGEKVIEAMKPFQFEEYHKNFVEARFIDVNEKTIQRKTDEEIIELLKKKYKCNSTSDFQNLPTPKRDKYVLELKKHGASLRQISRLTGISLGIIRGILK
ncbi:transposase [Methanobrevibacter sp.]